MISIITPSYNSSEFISETIESVLKQTYNNWEMIIVDDCSNDNSVEIINGFIEKEDRIKLIELDKNVGAAEARNVAIRKAKGRYIAFLDSDDLWIPEKLEKQLSFMKDNEKVFTFSSYKRITEKGEYINTIKVPSQISYKKFLRNTIIGTLTVVIDKDSVGEFKMPDIKSSQDMALWCDILKRGFNAYGIDEVLGYYRLVATSNTSKKWKAARDVWKVYRKIENLSILYSVFNFVGYVFNVLKKNNLNKDNEK